MPCQYRMQRPQIANGRVDLLSKTTRSPLFNVRPEINNESFASEAIRGQIERNPVSDLFFSPENIEALQQGIRFRIFSETNGKFTVGRQSDTELKIIMRSIFFANARGDPIGVVGQVRELNVKVLEYAVPNVLSNVKQYERYRVDASTLPMPMDRGALATNKGTRTLEIKSFF